MLAAIVILVVLSILDVLWFAECLISLCMIASVVVPKFVFGSTIARLPRLILAFLARVNNLVQLCAQWKQSGVWASFGSHEEVGIEEALVEIVVLKIQIETAIGNLVGLGIEVGKFGVERTVSLRFAWPVFVAVRRLGFVGNSMAGFVRSWRS